jgi:DNA adenine methylase
MAKAKQFIKWAGGKGQLLDQLDAYLPEEFGERRNITYIEPFVGVVWLCFSICYSDTIRSV